MELTEIILLGRILGAFYFILSHAKISQGFVKNCLKITPETKEWQKIILKPEIIW
jgi:hypothetical protein